MKLNLSLAILLFLTLLAKTVFAEPVRFARAESVLSLPVLVAEEKGFFAAEGVAVEFITTFAGKQSVQKLLNGDADIAVSGTPPVVKGFMQGHDYCVPAAITQADNAQKIITARSKQIDTALDLIGKKVGVPFGTGADFGFREYLFFNGLDRTDLKLIDIRPDKLSEGLQANDIDALVIWEPLASKVKAAMGDEYAQVATGNGMLLEYVMLVTPDFQNQQGSELRKILRALEKANQFMAREPDAAIRLQSQRLGLPAEQSRQFFSEHLYSLTIGPRLVHAFERIAEMVREDSGKTLKTPDFGKVFCEEALLDVVPQNYLLRRK